MATIPKDFVQQLTESNERLKEHHDEVLSRPLRKPREIMGLCKALRQSMGEPKTGVKGKNKAVIQLVNKGVTDVTGAKVPAKELKAILADILEQCNGVTVDRRKFQLSPTFMQSMIRLYNRPEVDQLLEPVPQPEFSDRVFEEDDEN